MIEALAGPLEAGLVKIYAVDSFDSGSWYRGDLPLEERARLHGCYEDWILNQVVPWIQADSHGAEGSPSPGSASAPTTRRTSRSSTRTSSRSRSARAASTTSRSSLRPAGGERGDAVYFNNPADYVGALGGDHLDWLRGRVHLLLLCGQGAWEDSTGALESTRRFAHLLGEKGIPHELDVWGHDVPHDWPAWRAQIAHHLPRFL